MKLSLPRADLLAQLQTVDARGLDAQRRAGAVRRHDLRRSRQPAASCGPRTWRSACACRSSAEVERPGSVVLPARLLLDVVRSLPASSDDGAAQRRAGRRADLRRRRPSTCARCAPRTSRRCRSPTRRRRVALPPRRSCRRSSQRRPLGLARRDASGADRDPRVGLRARSCGWSRPTPTA